jgi:hypothetical protein
MLSQLLIVTQRVEFPTFCEFSNSGNNLQILVVSSFLKATGKHARRMSYGGKYCVQFDSLMM